MKFLKYVYLILLAVVFVLIVSGCIAGPNESLDTPSAQGVVAGFWLGFWHGIISPITFILSLFLKNIHFYEVHNNGGWYNAGYALGVLIVLGGGGSRTRYITRRERIYVEPA